MSHLLCYSFDKGGEQVILPASQQPNKWGSGMVPAKLAAFMS
jgi:hypothetical protein